MFCMKNKRNVSCKSSLNWKQTYFFIGSIISLFLILFLEFGKLIVLGREKLAGMNEELGSRAQKRGNLNMNLRSCWINFLLLIHWDSRKTFLAGWWGRGEASNNADWEKQSPKFQFFDSRCKIVIMWSSFYDWKTPSIQKKIMTVNRWCSLYLNGSERRECLFLIFKSSEYETFMNC